MRGKTKRSKKVKELLYSSFQGNEATRFGTDMEATAKEQYITYQHNNNHPDLSVQNCGLFVSDNNNWLGASPDGIVQDPSDPDQPSGLLEIKNPFSIRTKFLKDACSSSTFCLEIKNNKLQLKHRHNFYYQVQCQLYCPPLNGFNVSFQKDMRRQELVRFCSKN